MNKIEIKAVIKADLTPRYETSRDSLIAYINSQRERIALLREDFKKQKQTVDGKENPKWREHYTGFYGYYDTVHHKQVDGNYYDGISKKHREYINMSEAKAKSLITKEYKEQLTNLVQAIADEIMALKPKAVESGYDTEHDMHFLLTMKDGERRSYTINTIIAGGAVQIIHHRTLRKLHKGVI